VLGVLMCPFLFLIALGGHQDLKSLEAVKIIGADHMLEVMRCAPSPTYRGAAVGNTAVVSR